MCVPQRSHIFINVWKEEDCMFSKVELGVKFQMESYIHLRL